MNKEDTFQSRAFKVALAVISVVLIVYTVFFVYRYSENIKEAKNEAELDYFCETMETMKTISEGYFDREKMSLREWSDYIENTQMTKTEALQYIHNNLKKTSPL